MQSLPAILHPSSSTYLILYDIWWGGHGKREEAGGEERKEVAGVGRGMKNVKILKGWKKGKFFACRSEKGGGRQGAGGVRPTPPPCPPSHIWKAGCNHFEKCVDPSTVIIIKKWKKSKTFYANIVRRWDNSPFFFAYVTPPPPRQSLLVSRELNTPFPFRNEKVETVVVDDAPPILLKFIHLAMRIIINRKLF